METISLNGKWKCRSDIKNLGIKNKWFVQENYNLVEKSLINIEIPRSYNLLHGFESFEGIFWHFYRPQPQQGRRDRNCVKQNRRCGCCNGAEWGRYRWCPGAAHRRAGAAAGVCRGRNRS